MLYYAFWLQGLHFINARVALSIKNAPLTVLIK